MAASRHLRRLSSRIRLQSSNDNAQRLSTILRTGLFLSLESSGRSLGPCTALDPCLLSRMVNNRFRSSFRREVKSMGGSSFSRALSLPLNCFLLIRRTLFSDSYLVHLGLPRRLPQSLSSSSKKLLTSSLEPVGLFLTTNLQIAIVEDPSKPETAV